MGSNATDVVIDMTAMVSKNSAIAASTRHVDSLRRSRRQCQRHATAYVVLRGCIEYALRSPSSLIVALGLDAVARPGPGPWTRRRCATRTRRLDWATRATPPSLRHSLRSRTPWTDRAAGRHSEVESGVAIPSPLAATTRLPTDPTLKCEVRQTASGDRYLPSSSTARRA